MATSMTGSDHDDHNDQHDTASVASRDTGDVLDSLAAKYAAEDVDDPEDGAEGAGEEGNEQDPPERPAARRTEDPEPNTESAPDGDAEEIGSGSDDEADAGADADDQDDHPTAGEAEESAEGDAAPEGATDDEEEGEGGEETRERLQRHGADLTLDDVPAEFRPILEKKVQAADAAFTRAMQELRAYQREQAAEERYRADNPELVIVELLQAGGAELFERVNQRLDALDPTAVTDPAKVAENRTALEQDIADRRKAAQSAIDAAQSDHQQRLDRAVAVETYAKTAAEKLGLPYGKTLERAIAAEILARPDEERGKGLTNEEVDAIIADYAKEHQHLVRRDKREASQVEARTRASAKAAPKPTVRPAKAAVSPGSAPSKKVAVNVDDEDERLAAMDRSARRILAATGATK